MNEKEILDRVLKLNIDFIKKNNNNLSTNWIEKFWCDSDIYKKSFIKKIKIDKNYVNDKEIIDTYDKHGIIILRKIKNEKKLVLGCGNHPFAFEGSLMIDCVENNEPYYIIQLPKKYPIHYKDKVFDKEDLKYILYMKNKFREKCKHTNEYTINPDIGMNPSIVGLFGIQDMRNILPENYFTTILFEGFMIYGYLNDNYIKANRCTISNLIWTLEENGKVQISKSRDEYGNKIITPVMIKKNGKLYSELYDVYLDDDKPNTYNIFYLICDDKNYNAKLKEIVEMYKMKNDKKYMN